MWPIDADALYAEFEKAAWYNNADRDEVAEPLLLAAPIIDAEVVVRCRDCKWQHTIDCPMNYEVDFFNDDDGWDSYMATNACHDDGFCWIGERKDGDGHG